MRLNRATGLLALAFAIAVPVAAQEKQAGARASAAEYEGWRQYMVACARCHGDDAVGGVMAPDLRTSVSRGTDAQSFHAVVSTGRREKGMPAFKDTLSDTQINAIYAYVDARAANRLPAGRPEQSGG